LTVAGRHILVKIQRPVFSKPLDQKNNFFKICFGLPLITPPNFTKIGVVDFFFYIQNRVDLTRNDPIDNTKKTKIYIHWTNLSNNKTVKYLNHNNELILQQWTPRSRDDLISLLQSKCLQNYVDTVKVIINHFSFSNSFEKLK